MNANVRTAESNARARHSNWPGAGATGAWLREQRPRPAATLSLICLPHAGGGASTFRRWNTQLPASIATLAVQYPGHEGRWREPLCRRVHDIVGPLVQVIEADVTTDVAVFGHSLGALIAFELARALRLRRRAPAHLFVSCCRAPHVPLQGPPMHMASDAALLTYLDTLGGIPAEVAAHRQFVSAVLPVLRADLAMDESYVFESGLPLECPITCFHGAHDVTVAREHASAWSQHTRTRFRMVRLPTGHFWSQESEDSALAIVEETARATARCSIR